VLIDGYVPNANFTSARQLDVAAPTSRVWQVLPDLPVLLRRSRLAIPATGPLILASFLRREMRRGDITFGRKPWLLREGEVLVGQPTAGASSTLRVARIDDGREAVLEGHHRFADYATSFYIEPLGATRSRIHNVTRASFKTGGIGTLYLTGVRLFHNLYVDWMLRHIRNRAEQI
jgi:hypothetical protein